MMLSKTVGTVERSYPIHTDPSEAASIAVGFMVKEAMAANAVVAA